MHTDASSTCRCGGKKLPSHQTCMPPFVVLPCLQCCTDSMSLESIGARNIRFTKWAPQNDVLGHPAVKAFITHAGSNSLYEAAYHGKPIVCIPLMADQFDQAARVISQPFAHSAAFQQHPWVSAVYTVLDFVIEVQITCAQPKPCKLCTIC